MNSHDSGPGKARSPRSPSTVSRRAAISSGIVATAATGGFLIGDRTGSKQEQRVPQDAGTQADAPRQPSPHGPVQPGVTSPAPRQAHVNALVCDLSGVAGIADFLDELGSTIVEITSGHGLNGIDPAGLTITAGVGPSIVSAELGPSHPGATELPAFAKENLTEARRGGDLLLQICSDEPAVVALAEAEILRRFPRRLSLRWQAQGFRGKPDHGVGRNLLGFHDGLAVPRTALELEADVWLSGPSALMGATLAVVRVMPIDVHAFSSLSLPAQEAAVGRMRDSGEPLSGGTAHDDVDLHDKLSSGEFTISNTAHARRAHPLPAGAPGLMLRRSYSYFRDRNDQGLIFISFQNEIETFIRTQQRIDEGDAMLDHTTTTASASFLILPGYDESKLLGAAFR